MTFGLVFCDITQRHNGNTCPQHIPSGCLSFVQNPQCKSLFVFSSSIGIKLVEVCQRSLQGHLTENNKKSRKQQALNADSRDSAEIPNRVSFLLHLLKMILESVWERLMDGRVPLFPQR